MNIQEIQVTKLPVVIITDTHTNITLIRKLREMYPDNQFICLGDITFLFAKAGDQFNKHSINFFIESKIPCLFGNHEEHIVACDNYDNGDTLYQWKSLPLMEGQSGLSTKYGLDKVHIDYLKSLPRGFKLNLPDGTHYLCFHNRPNELWAVTDRGTLTEEDFKNSYPINDKTIAVLHGHMHRNFIVNHPTISTKRICIGRLSKDGDYALLTDKGIEFKYI